VASLKRNRVVIEAVQQGPSDLWIWRIRRGTQLVAVGTETYARQDSLMRALKRLVIGLSAELGLVRKPKARRKAGTPRRKHTKR
jgi:hypothetical protein